MLAIASAAAIANMVGGSSSAAEDNMERGAAAREAGRRAAKVIIESQNPDSSFAPGWWNNECERSFNTWYDGYLAMYDIRIFYEPFVAACLNYAGGQGFSVPER